MPWLPPDDMSVTDGVYELLYVKRQADDGEHEAKAVSKPIASACSFTGTVSDTPCGGVMHTNLLSVE